MRIQQIFPNRMETAGCSSPGGPENPTTAEVEPLGPAEEAEVMLTQPSVCGAGFWMPGLENKQSIRSASKRERKKADRMRAWQVQYSANRTSSISSAH